MDRVGASAQAIADALAPTPQAPSARWRWGTVVSVANDGTMNVSIGGSTVAGVRCAQHVMGAQVGDRVRVLYCGTEAMVDAVRASAKLMSLPNVYVADPAAFRDAVNVPSVTDQSAQRAGFTSGSGTEQVQIIGFNVTNGSHALAGKRLLLLVRSNGIDLYNNTDSSPVWQYRTTESTTTASSIFTAESGFTAGTCAYSSRLGIAQLVLKVTTTSALTANTTYTVGTIASGKRPAQIAAMSERVGTNTHGKVEIATDGTVTYRPTQAVSANVSCVFHTATYIIG